MRRCRGWALVVLLAGSLVAAPAGGEPGSPMPKEQPSSSPARSGELHPAAAPGVEQSSPLTEATLEEIVVSGAPEESEPNVARVNRRALERRAAKSAVEALEHEPSVNAGTGRRGERLFTMRGFDQRQVAVFLDGAPAYLPYDGQADLGLLPAEMIDHLTVIKGPASVLYGPNGLGGAVNIVTRPAGSGPLISLGAQAGRGNALLLSGVHAARLGPLGYTLYAGLRRRDALPLSSGFDPVPRENGVLRENSDEALYHAGGNFELRLRGTHAVTAAVAYVEGERGIPPGVVDPTARYWRLTDWRNLAISAGHRASYLDRKLVVDELAYLRLYDNLLDSFDDATYSSQQLPRAFHSWYHDQLMGGRARARYHLGNAPWGATDLRLWIGGQHDRHQDEGDAKTAAAAVSRTLLTAAPEVEAYLGERWSLTAALQMDAEVPGEQSEGDRASRLGLGPLLSARFDPLPELSLRATGARRSRFPTLRERFTSAQGTRVPNPDLRPETAWHLGLEAVWRAPRGLTLEGSVFDAEVTDLIDLVVLGGGMQQAQNIAGARLLGAELAASLSPWRHVTLRAGYAFLHARRSEPLAGSDELQYRPAHKGSLELILVPLPWIELTSGLRLVGAQPCQHPATSAWRELDAYAVWDLGLSLTPTRWSAVWLRAGNLLDARYETELGYPDPGRELWVGVRLTYDRQQRSERSGL